MNTQIAETQVTNPFALTPQLAELKERIVKEHGRDVIEWNRVPACKGSLVEISFNFVDDSIAPKGCSRSSIVPEWARWASHYYDPSQRNLERDQDAVLNDRTAHGTVPDRPGMVLSANARLDTSKVKGRVRLGTSFWTDLEAQGFQWIEAYAQWKMPSDKDAAIEHYAVSEIVRLQDMNRGKVSDHIRELFYLESKLEHCASRNEHQRLSENIGAIRGRLNDYDQMVKKLQEALPARKGWFRVYFAHKDSDLYRKILTDLSGHNSLVEDVILKLVSDTPRDLKVRRRFERQEARREMIRDLKGLFERSWGRTVVWQNPSTRTNASSNDLSRHPKIAIQMMNDPKGCESANLVLRGNFFSVE